VVGGTPFDAQLGAKYLAQKGIQSTAIGLNPKPQQTADLYHQPKALQAHFEKTVQPAKFSEVLIYCNSLSFAAHWAQLYPGKIWELTVLYQDILQSSLSKKTLALTAESRMQKHLQQLATQLKAAKNLKVEAHFDLVKSLEKLSPQEQVTRTREFLKECLNQDYTQVIFACTHFDNPVFDNYQDLEIVQPGLQLLEQFAEAYRLGTV
jgi:glutamate racemase